MSRDHPSGLHTYLDQDMTEPVMVPIDGAVATVFSARCPGKQTPNEDAAAIIPFKENSAVLLVADGLGGSAGGEQASRVTIETMQSSIAEARRTDALLRTAIINGIEQANTTIQELGIGAATTLAAVELDNGTIRSYHVGDSMILVVGGRGKIKLQTVPHSPVGYGIEAGLLDETDAMHHEDRHFVSNTIGSPDMTIDIGPTKKLAPRDTVLLASDGLLDNLLCDEITAIIRKGKLTKSAARLVQESTLRMNGQREGQPSKPDDLTFIAFRIG